MKNFTLNTTELTKAIEQLASGGLALTNIMRTCILNGADAFEQFLEALKNRNAIATSWRGACIAYAKEHCGYVPSMKDSKAKIKRFTPESIQKVLPNGMELRDYVKEKAKEKRAKNANKPKETNPRRDALRLINKEETSVLLFIATNLENIRQAMPKE